MKKLLALLAIPALLYGQGISIGEPNQGTGEISGFLYTISDTTGGTPRIGSLIYGRTFTSISVDTTQAIPTYRGQKFTLYLSAKDSCSILAHYQVSDDGKSWAATDTLDSLKVTTLAYDLKAIDVSTAALAGRYIRFRLEHSTKAYAKGTTTPTYSASYAIRRD